MAGFVILIYANEAQWQDADGALMRDVTAEHEAFAARYGDVITGGAGLALTSSARTVRDGIVTDGPFLETKEALGGFYLVEAEDVDAAVEIARSVPAHGGCVEVRPVDVPGS